MNPTPFTRTPWMIAEVRRIAYTRFPSLYWPSIEDALLNCLESHSVVIKAPNKDKHIAAFVLVCPPTTSSKAAYGVETCLPASILEIAFVATDEGWEGCGFARSLLEVVLFRCTTAQQSAWLHVDTVNEKARAFYERLGFRNFLDIPDPYGSLGTLMVFSIPHRYHKSLQGTTLLNAPPCKPEQAFGRGILAPPSLACY
jgi:ribosomal protein S18 acetylase RimI-like enzyme